ncbi:MAG: MotA/TolQ/ExbB proton channel family protein [Euryarchaeota archaeon]|nr:MotA/TolQ/ExbB proton channel family protein [Euryarchaeota archaeon]
MVSTSLLYPVVLALLGLIALSLLYLGSFAAEYASRNRDIRRVRMGCIDAKAHIENKEFEKASDTLKNCGSNDLLTDFIADIGGFIGKPTFGIEAEKLLQDYELRIAKELENPRLVARIGPMLGLMGTLIPMGPALIALSAGNIHELATNLVIAFATTVLGLLVGGVGYGIASVKKRWYSQDMSDMDYIVEMMKR